MKISCCIPCDAWISEKRNKDPLTAYTRLMKGYQMIRSLGYDIAEATVGMVMALSLEEVNALQAAHRAGMFNIGACNCFIPGEYSIISDTKTTEKLYAYVENAICRMADLGVSYVVFGSGRARAIPENYDRSSAEAQIDAFLRWVDICCEKYGMTCVIEPLNKLETNWCNTVAEGAAIVRRLNLKNIGLLADGYHMACEAEPYTVITENCDILQHCHIASSDRTIPGRTAYESGFLAALKKIDYERIVTVECGFGDFHCEAKIAAEYLRKQLA